MSTEFAKTVYKWLFNAQFCLFPGTCIVCQQQAYRNKDLCRDCESRLVRVRSPCLNCGLPLPPGNLTVNLCGACLVQPPPFGRLIAPYRYCPPVSGLITAFKYNNRITHARVLSELLCTYLTQHYQRDAFPSLIIPVPLHPGRVRKRGFNQALEITRFVSAKLNIPLRRQGVKRTRETQQQTGLNARARTRNIRSAFCVDQDASYLANARIALIDDVVTTGATVTELSKILLQAGAREVHIWALARTFS